MQPSPGPGPHGASLPMATLALQAARRAQALHGRDLPRLRELRDLFLREADAWCGAALGLALQAHVDAACALRFDLLVARGLRDAPSRQDEEAFRLQVEAVSACTEVTWLLVRDAVLQASHEDSMAPAALDFLMGSRAIQRETAQVAASVAALHGPLRDAADVPATAFALERLGEASRLLAPLEAACLPLAHVHRCAWQANDAQAGLHKALRDLALLLRGGLLARLAALLAPDAPGAAAELEAARQSRDTLVAALRAAACAVDAVHAARLRVVDALEAMPDG